MKKTFLFLTSAVLLWGANLETKTLESRCKNEDAKSCFELGNKFEESKNYQKAGEFYKKACELKHAGACSSVGVLYDMDYIKDVNNKNAAKFYQKGCELNDGFGCASGDVDHLTVGLYDLLRTGFCCGSTRQQLHGTA